MNTLTNMQAQTFLQVFGLIARLILTLVTLLRVLVFETYLIKLSFMHQILLRCAEFIDQHAFIICLFSQKFEIILGVFEDFKEVAAALL